MDIQEVAQTLVAMCRQGQFREAIAALYSEDIVSVEAGAPPGGDREVKGIPAVLGKSDWWVNNHEVHESIVEGPLVAGAHFAVKFDFDVTFKPTGKRFRMCELAVYQVAGGKVVREEFFYQM